MVTLTEQTFPFKAVFRDVPDNHKCLSLISYNIDYVYKYLEQKKNEGFTKGYDRPHISFESFQSFSRLVTTFADEVANNIERQSLSYEHLAVKTKILNDKLDQCINLIESNKDDFFNIEMHDPYFDSDGNWYKFIYTELKSIKQTLKGYLKHLHIPDLTKNPIFPQKLLVDFWRKFNDTGELWKYIEINPFIESWQGKGNKIEIINYNNFCFAVGMLEPYRDKTEYPNMDKFIEKTFNFKDYKGRKRNNPKDEHSNSAKTKREIKRKIDALIKQIDI